jgi:hypothetical protein
LAISIKSRAEEALAEAFVGYAGYLRRPEMPFWIRRATALSVFTGRERLEMLLYRPRFHDPQSRVEAAQITAGFAARTSRTISRSAEHSTHG